MKRKFIRKLAGLFIAITFITVAAFTSSAMQVETFTNDFSYSYSETYN